MRIATNEAPRVELGSLKPGDVYSLGGSDYWIVSDTRDGNKVHVLQLNSGLLLNVYGSSMVIPVPNACLHV